MTFVTVGGPVLSWSVVLQERQISVLLSLQGRGLSCVTLAASTPVQVRGCVCQGCKRTFSFYFAQPARFFLIPIQKWVF